MLYIFVWMGAGLLTALLILWPGTYVIPMARSELGRVGLLLGAVQIIVIWGVLGALWLYATGGV
jgi:hypothetical protein